MECRYTFSESCIRRKSHNWSKNLDLWFEAKINIVKHRRERGKGKQKEGAQSYLSWSGTSLETLQVNWPEPDRIHQDHTCQDGALHPHTWVRCSEEVFFFVQATLGQKKKNLFLQKNKSQIRKTLVNVRIFIKTAYGFKEFFFFLGTVGERGPMTWERNIRGGTTLRQGDRKHVPELIVYSSLSCGNVLQHVKSHQRHWGLVLKSGD